MSPDAVSPVSDLKKLEPCIPSTVSASKPEPEPSTVLISVSISLADWSAVAPDSMPSNLLWSASVNTLLSEADSTKDLISLAV